MGEISYRRFPLRNLQVEVRDPSFVKLLEDGYRPILAESVEDRADHPEVLMVLAQDPKVVPDREVRLLLRAVLAVQVAILVALVIGLLR